MMEETEGIISIQNSPATHIYETGIYQNVYRYHGDWGNLHVDDRLFESPEDAKKHIQWDKELLEYLYTAKMTSTIHRFDKK